MKPRSRKKPAKGAMKRSRSGGSDPFFEPGAKRRRRDDDFFDDIDSEEDEEGVGDSGGEEEEEAEEETADEKRFRIAMEHLDRVKAASKRAAEAAAAEEEAGSGEEEEDGRKDSLVAEALQKEQLEESGRVRRSLASRVQKPESIDEFQLLVKHHQSVTAVALAEDDARGFSASKDGSIMHWDVESGKHEKYLWPNEDVLLSHFAKSSQNLLKKRSKHVLALAVSSDGRYLASGGLDRHVHLWDTRTRGHIQAFHGHRGPVSCLTFRRGTLQLFSGSFDRTIKLWNAEDRTYMDSLFGHQSEVLTIDSLQKERLLTVGRDRTMRLFKVPEESQLVFRAPASSLECCCFINDSEFLSGSDDGSIELWSIMRKKPTHIIKNAHVPLSVLDNNLHAEDKEGLPNGDIKENGNCKAECQSSAQSWVGSVAVCRASDLAASGAGNGVVRLWAVESDNKSIQPLFDYPLVGFVNSLTFAKSGRFLLAGLGQEPRLGRWERIPAARNGVAIHPIRFRENRTLV